MPSATWPPDAAISRRAIELTREIDKLSKTSPVGALLRARIYAAQGKARDLAAGVQGSPRPRSSPARAACPPGPNQAQAGRRRRCTPPGQHGARRREKPSRRSSCSRPAHWPNPARHPLRKTSSSVQAIARLEAITKANPRFEDAFHTLAEFNLKRGNHAAAVAVLKDDLKANPTDAAAAVAPDRDPRDTPARRRRDRRRTADLNEAKRLAAEIAGAR